MHRKNPVCRTGTTKVSSSLSLSRRAETEYSGWNTVMNSSWWLKSITNKNQPEPTPSTGTPILKDFVSFSKEFFGMWPFIWPCLLYSGSACILQIINKILFKDWGFCFVFSLTLIQAVFTICAFFLAALLGIVTLPAIRWKAIAAVVPLALLSVGNTATGQLGLRNVSLPMFLVLRRLVTPTVMLCEFLLWRRRQPAPVVASLVVLSAGSLIAGLSDLTFDLRGYGYTLLANAFTAVYTMHMKGLSMSESGVCVPVTDLYFYSALLTLPLLAVCSAAAGEMQELGAFAPLADARLQGIVAVSSVLASVYQLALLVCTTRNSPLATSVAGNFKDLFGSVLGAMWFDDFVATGASLLGLAVSLVGAASFLAFKVMDQSRHADAATARRR